MKILPPILVLLCVFTAAGQVTTSKNDILESQFLLAEVKAAELFKTVNYRLVWTKEFLAERSKEAKLQERTVREVLQPNKWRTVVERFSDSPSREERIWDGKALYVRLGDKPWEKFDGGGSTGVRMEQGQYRNQFRFLPAVEFEGGKADFYEHVSVRTANKYSQNDLIVVRYIRTSRSWFGADGKILKKTEETVIDGREEMLREVTTYEYNPKNLKIEAPRLK